MAETSTKPYLIRAIYEWCNDNGFRPYLAVAVDEHTVVPNEFVRNGEIVLNVSADATSRLVLGNEMIEFEARFNRVARAVSIPVVNVTAVYAAENGHGMAFDVPKALAIAEPPDADAPAKDERARDGDADVAQQAGEQSAPSRGAALLEAVPSAPRGAHGDGEGVPASEPAPAPGTGGKRPHLTRIK